MKGFFYLIFTFIQYTGTDDQWSEKTNVAMKSVNVISKKKKKKF